MKAKSRLKSAEPVVPNKADSTPLSPVSHQVQSPRLRKSDTPSQLRRYVKHWLTLALSLPFYGVVAYVFNSVHPDSVKSVLLPNLYLFFQVPLFFANFFFFSFVLLNTRRGFMVALLIQIFVFSQLLSLILSPLYLLGIGLGFVIIEAGFIAYNHKRHG